MDSLRDNLLNGRIALITESSRGLGRAIAARLAASGAKGVAVDLDENAARCAAPPGWIGIAADVRDEDSVRRAVSAAIEQFGQLDIVVANAGLVPPWAETENIDLVLWDEVFAVNVRGVIATVKAAVPAMKARGGSIILMGSFNSRRAHPRQCVYVASKHAVHGIARATALDLGRFSIRVNALAPGAIATEALLERVKKRAAGGGPPLDVALRELGESAALGRMATEQDVANTALFLASDLSIALTGLLVPIDAGLD